MDCIFRIIPERIFYVTEMQFCVKGNPQNIWVCSDFWLQCRSKGHRPITPKLVASHKDKTSHAGTHPNLGMTVACQALDLLKRAELKVTDLR